MKTFPECKAQHGDQQKKCVKITFPQLFLPHGPNRRRDSSKVKYPAPAELFEPLADLLKKYDTAAEINFHCNQPDEEFFALCLQKGVKISLGSDTHNLYEVGEFYPHVKFLDKIAPGWRSDPQEIMLQA